MTDPDEKLAQRIKYEAVEVFNSHFVIPFQHEGSWYIERLGLAQNTYYKAIVDDTGITFAEVLPEVVGKPPNPWG